ncbi:MAG: hypothetical protein II670_11590, partial [Alphaproteobacteria bacterium]|nr:hypothetical protein [Alphaproteobacteria bacterium]
MASAEPKRTEKEGRVNNFSQIVNYIIDFGFEIIYFYGISISYFFSLQSVSFGRTCGSSAW